MTSDNDLSGDGLVFELFLGTACTPAAFQPYGHFPFLLDFCSKNVLAFPVISFFHFDVVIIIFKLFFSLKLSKSFTAGKYTRSSCSLINLISISISVIINITILEKRVDTLDWTWQSWSIYIQFYGFCRTVQLENNFLYIFNDN